MSEGEDFYAFTICGDSVLDVVTNAREVQTTNAGQRDITRASADVGLD
jgi:hypothetical protein